MKSNLYEQLRARRDDRRMERIGWVLFAVAVIGFGLCAWFGVPIIN